MPKVKGKRDEYRFVRELVTVMGVSKGGLKELYDKLYDSREELRAENQRLKVVVEAAKEWKRVRDNFTSLHASSMTNREILAVQQGVIRVSKDLDDALQAYEEVPADD